MESEDSKIIYNDFNARGALGLPYDFEGYVLVKFRNYPEKSARVFESTDKEMPEADLVFNMAKWIKSTGITAVEFHEMMEEAKAKRESDKRR